METFCCCWCGVTLGWRAGEAEILDRVYCSSNCAYEDQADDARRARLGTDRDSN